MRCVLDRRASSFCLLLGLTACAALSSRSEQGLAGANDVRVVTARAIEESGAHTVWDALRRTVPFYVFHDNGRVEHRGRTSLLLQDQPLIVLDGVTLTDVSVLTGMPASNVWLIEVLDGVDGTTHYGTGAGQGVIRIWTKTAES